MMNKKNNNEENSKSRLTRQLASIYCSICANTFLFKINLFIECTQEKYKEFNIKCFEIICKKNSNIGGFMVTNKRKNVPLKNVLRVVLPLMKYLLESLLLELMTFRAFSPFYCSLFLYFLCIIFNLIRQDMFSMYVDKKINTETSTQFNGCLQFLFKVVVICLLWKFQKRNDSFIAGVM